MSPLVRFPDVVELVVNYLYAELAVRGETAGVASELPNPIPARFVQVTKVRDQRRNVGVLAGGVTVRAWADSIIDAVDLAELCRDLLYAMPGYGPVRKIEEFGGPVPEQDVSDKPNHRLTVDVIVRGAQAA